MVVVQAVDFDKPSEMNEKENPLFVYFEFYFSKKDKEKEECGHKLLLI